MKLITYRLTNKNDELIMEYPNSIHSRYEDLYLSLQLIGFRSIIGVKINIFINSSGISKKKTMLIDTNFKDIYNIRFKDIIRSYDDINTIDNVEFSFEIIDSRKLHITDRYFLPLFIMDDEIDFSSSEMENLYKAINRMNSKINKIEKDGKQ